jgi:hypothetical protein
VSKARSHATVGLVLVAVVGCKAHHGIGTDSGNPGGDAPSDSFVYSACWPATYTPSGSVQLGTGSTSFETMPSMLPLQYATQSAGYGFPVQARVSMSAFQPGDFSNPLDPNNPRTRFSASFADNGDVICTPSCDRHAYVPSPGGGGTYDMYFGGYIEFSNAISGSAIFGRPVTVIVEVIDSNSDYATSQQTITVEQPATTRDIPESIRSIQSPR